MGTIADGVPFDAAELGRLTLPSHFIFSYLKELSHTIAFMLNQTKGNPPLQLARLLV